MLWIIKRNRDEPLCSKVTGKFQRAKPFILNVCQLNLKNNCKTTQREWMTVRGYFVWVLQWYLMLRHCKGVSYINCKYFRFLFDVCTYKLVDTEFLYCGCIKSSENSIQELSRIQLNTSKNVRTFQEVMANLICAFHDIIYVTRQRLFKIPLSTHGARLLSWKLYESWKYVDAL